MTGTRMKYGVEFFYQRFYCWKIVDFEREKVAKEYRGVYIKIFYFQTKNEKKRGRKRFLLVSLCKIFLSLNDYNK